MPANGLIYTFPKHCICWPMLRDYAALAPARPGGEPRRDDAHASRRSPARPQRAARRAAGRPGRGQWPCYRHDAWRSGSTAGQVPARAEDPLDHRRWAAGPRARSPTTGGATTSSAVRSARRSSPGGLVYVARPDAHQVVALDADRPASVRWTFTANGRVDTAPTIHRGLCLFGSKSGWVYCLRADDGRLVWRLRAAPLDERIVAYGQIESPWPVPGSVLVVDDVALFRRRAAAAGRRRDPGLRRRAGHAAGSAGSSGSTACRRRSSTAPAAWSSTTSTCLQREGDAVAMSRWLFDRAHGQDDLRAQERLRPAGRPAAPA